LAPQRVPKSVPKSIQNGAKNIAPKSWFWRACWDPPKAILGHFGAPLGVKNHQKPLVFIGSQQNQLFGRKNVTKTTPRRLWAPKCTKMTPQRLPDELQNRPKIQPKMHQQNDEISTRFLIDFGGLWRPMTLKPEEQANGKRRFKFTKASQAQPSTAKHSQAQPSTAKHSQA